MSKSTVNLTQNIRRCSWKRSGKVFADFVTSINGDSIVMKLRKIFRRLFSGKIKQKKPYQLTRKKKQSKRVIEGKRKRQIKTIVALKWSG